jgi:hypothetical protein
LRLFFILLHIIRFTLAVDANCTIEALPSSNNNNNTLESKEPSSKTSNEQAPSASSSSSIVALNCSAEERALVQQCSAPLADLQKRLNELFQGGFQTFLKNLNSLSIVFAQGSRDS